MFKILLKTFILFNCAFAQEWLPPYFEPNPDENVNLTVTESDKTASIRIDENIDYHIVAVFYTYKGPVQPEVVRFIEPPNTNGSLLGLEITRNQTNEKWAIVITKPQDFDNGEERYSFITKIDKVEFDFYVLINNLEDEIPIIELTSSSTPCLIMENYKGLTNCTIQISDKDGHKSNMKYDISSTVVNNVKDIFHIKNDGNVSINAKTWMVVLEMLKEVDCETYPSYVLQFTVTDSGNLSDTEKLIIQVEDLPDTPPRWNKFITSETFPEKEAQSFNVSATDGDLQINAKISYKIESEWPDIFKVERDTGIVRIEEIDRDYWKNELFSFNLIAYETDNETSNTPQLVTIVVIDKDDHVPTITLDTSNVEIYENRLATLPITIQISDLDLSDNAKYDVWLLDSQFSEAFQIVPSSGYQNATFSISVINSQLLDYEKPDWRNFDLTIRSEENINKTQSDEQTITIALINWNDEEPVFTETEYNANVFENVSLGYEIIKVEAKDEDYGDNIIYTLLGVENNRLFTIDTQGMIKTNHAQAFNYEKQTTVFVQIQAEDTLEKPYHKTVVQLTINVTDVNDEPPTISVGSTLISVEENVENGSVLNEDTEISAYDVDTDAKLEFSIDWSKSYGLKNGVKKNVKEWVIVETKFVSTNTGAANAILKAADVIDSGTPDYELFDTMNLALIVTDLNQQAEPNKAEVPITISIKDLNDNSPEFQLDTITRSKSVVEGSAVNTTIGTIIAIDKDGPDHNEVIYSLRPKPDTPDNWIDIDPTSGTLYVTSNDISADDPVVYKLNYTVIAINEDDENRKSEAEITINVIDTNNRAPDCTFEQEIHIKENVKNDFKLPQTISCTDKDRDESYHTLWYRFASTTTEIRNLFNMNESTGIITVAIQDGFELDRDRGLSSYTIPFVVKDNLNQEGNIVQLSFEGSFILILDDVNDNSPIIKTTSIDGKEDMLKDTILGEILAEDIDEPNTDNSKIEFEIIEITKGDDAGNDLPKEHFSIIVNDATSGKGNLVANDDLRGFYGTYTALIKAYDFGTDPKSQSSEKNITISITKFNFCPPIFTNPSPSNNQAIYLSKKQELNQPLITPDGNVLQPFQASDQQNEKWDIDISIDPVYEGFTIRKSGKSEGNLYLSSNVDISVQHQLSLLADCKCSGLAQSTTSLSIKVRFIDLDSEPEYIDNNESLEFPENSTNITKQLPLAYFNAESEEWDYPSYYFLKSDESKAFEINRNTAELTLINALDRETRSNWTLTVIASRKQDGNLNAGEKSTLTVFIQVTDINDNPPSFDKDEFYASVKPSHAVDFLITTLTATDLDIDEELNIIILPETLEASGTGINNIQNPFCIKSETQTLENNVIGKGNVHLNFRVQSNMNGYFRFQAKVIDQANQEAVTSVKIYLVSESTEVRRTFSNNLDTVVDKQDIVRSVFEENIGYRCNIESISISSDESGQPNPEETEVVMHFVNTDTNEAIESTTINQLLEDVSRFLKLKKELGEEGLYILSVEDNLSGENNEELLRAWLIGVSVILGTLCMALIVAFIMKTKSLLNRLNKLSVPEKFGSTESGLNRAGLAAPNTNKHAEGANPIYSDEKKAPQYDTYSTGSGDSDLVGIEDNANFEIRRKDSVNSLFKENF